MAYKTNAPADDEFLADFPAEQREQHRAIVNDKIVNAGKLNGLTSGNASGNIPVSNGTKCTNLNADLLDGHDTTYFATSGHTHDAATQSSNGLMSNTDKKKLDGIATGAEVNQNAFANVKVGSTTIQADAKQDTLTLEAGDYISVTPDATNDKVTVSATGLLPLSGGTMTGTIRSNTNANIDATSSTRIEETVTLGVDKNGANLGTNFYSAVNTDVFNALRASNPNVNNGANWADIRLHVNSEGKRFISTDYHNSLTDGTTDNSNHIPTTAFIHGKYLSLSGGTMTGNLAADMNEFWIGNKKANNAGIITLRSANDSYKNGAALTLHGIGASGAGQFTLQAADGTNTPSLLGKADGTLKWNNSDIALAKNVLPLSGGTMTGTILVSGAGYTALRNTGTNGRVTIGGGTAYNTGAFLWMFGKDYGDDDESHGSFMLDAHNGTSYTRLRGTYNGKLTWGGDAIALAKNHLLLSGGTMTGQLVINRNNGAVGGGIKLTGAGQNFVISALNTNVTKGTAPSSTQYWGIDFYGKDQDSYNKRIGMLETTLETNNRSSVYIRAYNCTSNTNTGTASIGVSVDGNGNAYTYAPTPAQTDNSTKIATTAFVNTRANDYLPLAGGTMTGELNLATIKNAGTDAVRVCGGNDTIPSTGAMLTLFHKNHTNNGAFRIFANNGSSTKMLEGKPDGTLTWDGIGMCGTNIGNAGTSGATLTLPKNGTYLIIVTHNSTPELNGIFMARGWSGGGTAFKLAGAAKVSLTCSSNKITVTTTEGTVGVYYIYLG